MSMLRPAEVRILKNQMVIMAYLISSTMEEKHRNIMRLASALGRTQACLELNGENSDD